MSRFCLLIISIVKLFLATLNPRVPTIANVLNRSLINNPDVSLVTVGPTTLEIPPPPACGPNPGTLLWAAGTDSYVAGIDNVRLIVDPATNLVTTSSLLNTTLANWEMKEIKYDPATKTFTLNFRWNPTANLREYSVVLKYKGPR